MYTQDSYKEPFWAENSGFMTGRDPLGVQNSSVATYSRLLPGMTNVTLRLRYYGFYMWLLKEYDGLPKGDAEKTLTYHYNFIRKAELTIAYLMGNNYSDEMSIVGSDYANRTIDEIHVLGYYDLEKGTDKTKTDPDNKVYWEYPSGALGQYFAGSLINLKLIEVNNRFFIILEKGRKLAAAYDEGVSETSKQTLLEVIRSGRMTARQMDHLADFAINKIVQGSSEWTFYKEMILSDDGMSNSLGMVQHQRKETIHHYLEYLSDPAQLENEYSFDQFQYGLNKQKIHKDASFGWYYYRINELFHFALETIFWGLLVELDGRVMDIKEFLEFNTNRVLEYSLEEYLDSSDTTINQLIESDMDHQLLEDQNRLEALVKAGKSHYEAMALALKQMLSLYMDNKSNMDLLARFEQVNYLTDKKGRVTEIVNAYILANSSLTFDKFIYTCVKGLINDHIATAYRKMGNGESNLLKFVIEDNYITHVQTMTPKFTSPRLRTLDNFLTDLHFKEGKELSETGTKLLMELSN